MRVTTDFWVSAVLRRVFAAGGFAAVLRRGATEAGAIFVIQRGRDGSQRLIGPAPQASYDEAGPGERRFQEIVRSDDEDELRGRIDREVRFDPDIWLIEIEADEKLVDELIPVTMP
jgi:hypothetical protein